MFLSSSRHSEDTNNKILLMSIKMISENLLIDSYSHVTDLYFYRMTYLLKERISDSTDTHLWDSNDHWIMKVISMDLSLKFLKNFEIWIWLIKLISFRQRSFYRKYIISIENHLWHAWKFIIRIRSDTASKNDIQNGSKDHHIILKSTWFCSMCFDEDVLLITKLSRRNL